ncbi:MAG: hypothetical protein ABIH66_05225 [bacterium]
MAFYYPWYGTPEVSGKWSHWDWMEGAPYEMNDTGYPNLRIPFHPEGGVYDSSDPGVIHRHIALAEKAGIDVLIFSWWGPGSESDAIFEKLLDEIEKTGSQVRATVYYETVPGRDPKNAEKEFLYILEKYGGRNGFFRARNAPVIFIYSRAMFEINTGGWKRVVKRIKMRTPVLFIADMDFFAYLDIFDGIHRYNPVADVMAEKSTEDIYRPLMDICGKKRIIAAVTIIPGYDDRLLDYPFDTMVERRGGALYREMWEGAIGLRPDWVLITSFNEWHEGSQIEPAMEYGDKYLEITAEYSKKFKSEP